MCIDFISSQLPSYKSLAPTTVKSKIENGIKYVQLSFVKTDGSQSEV